MPISRTYLSTKEMRNISLWILLLLVTAWSWTTDQLTIDLRGFGAIIAPIACVILICRICRSFRDLLDQGAKISRTEKLTGHWSAFAILLPMCLEFSVTSHQLDETTFYFGGGASVITGIFGGAAIMLYETLRRMKFLTVNTRETLPESRPPERHSKPVAP